MPLSQLTQRLDAPETVSTDTHSQGLIPLTRSLAFASGCQKGVQCSSPLRSRMLRVSFNGIKRFLPEPDNMGKYEKEYLRRVENRRGMEIVVIAWPMPSGSMPEIGVFQELRTSFSKMRIRSGKWVSGDRLGFGNRANHACRMRLPRLATSTHRGRSQCQKPFRYQKPPKNTNTAWGTVLQCSRPSEVDPSGGKTYRTPRLQEY
jgi:hypothetical protein